MIGYLLDLDHVSFYFYATGHHVYTLRKIIKVHVPEHFMQYIWLDFWVSSNIYMYIFFTIVSYMHHAIMNL